MKNIIIALIVVAVIVCGIGFYFITKSPSNSPIQSSSDTSASTTPAVASSTPATPDQKNQQEVIGQSVEKRDIIAYHFGSGSTEILFVGGIHGGYAWNSVLVAYQLMDYLIQNPTSIASNLKVTVIPVINPDGLYKVINKTGKFTTADVSSAPATLTAGRFNAHVVDLNRNFDCNWQTSGTLQSKTVSGGSKAFSEPESLAIKTYIENNKPTAVIAWDSAAGGVYASSCGGSILTETNNLLNTYAKASGYTAHKDFKSYAVTGDMLDWLASIKIPAISILLTNHTDTDWTKNQAGVESILKYYAK